MNNRFILVTVILLLASLGNTASGQSLNGAVDDRSDFVDISELIPDIVLDIRYYGDFNFVGSRIDGYLAPKCLLTIQAADALLKVQQQLKAQNRGLKVFDCYRPQMAVDHFVRWAKDLSATQMKTFFYPHVAKKDLFKDGYIAEKSSHTRGSTLDLTVIELMPGQPMLDMGTGFDFFDPLSHTLNPEVTDLVAKNRAVLKSVMEDQGFKNLAEEWWHFTLKVEPYPDRYFNFPVQ